MHVEDTIELECGCLAAYDGVFEGYVVIGAHACDGSVLKQQAQTRKEERFNSRVESAQRNSAPLGSSTPFNLLR